MNTRDQFVATIKGTVDAWNRAIDEAEATLKANTLRTEAEFIERIAEMKRQRNEAERTLQEAREISVTQWKRQFQKFESAWTEISDGFSNAWSKLR